MKAVHRQFFARSVAGFEPHDFGLKAEFLTVPVPRHHTLTLLWSLRPFLGGG